jgi:predicted HicB family RNase H-like nuclease
MVNFRASARESQQLRQMAAERGTSLSELIRRSLAAEGFRPEVSG